MAAPALGFTPATAGVDDSLCYGSVDALKAMFRTRQASPVEVLKAQIKRIEAFNAKINTITYEHFEQALGEARRSEERYRRGDPRPLEGITVAIKDEADRAGWKTTMGSLILKDDPPATENAAVIDALESAGAVMPFQTTTPEFYLSANASTRAWGTTRNPWNLAYSPGGSSSGSAAALAAGFTTLALGSDGAGSIRIPASQCGLYGFKPPFGRVPTTEVQYDTFGGLARRFDDLVSMQNAIVGPSMTTMNALRPRLNYPSGYRGLGGWRIALDWGEGLAEPVPSVREAMRGAVATLREHGCVVDEVECGLTREHLMTFMRGMMATSAGRVAQATWLGFMLSPYVAEMINSVGPGDGPTRAHDAEKLIEKLHKQVQERVFRRGYRVILMPTVSSPLIMADLFHTNVDMPTATGMKVAMTWPWNLLYRYAVMDVPLGIVEDDMPTGMQVVADTDSDLVAFQFAFNWSKWRPPLFADGRFPTFGGG